MNEPRLDREETCLPSCLLCSLLNECLKQVKDSDAVSTWGLPVVHFSLENSSAFMAYLSILLIGSLKFVLLGGILGQLDC